MILSGKQIFEEIKKNQIVIEPYNEKQLGPNSYNLRLYGELAVYEDSLLDMKKPQKLRRIPIPEEGYVLEPGRLYLGRTVELTETKKFVPMLEGRSSIGRLGLSVHITAGFGDVGFKGFWTLEIYCLQPIRVYANVEICQIFYHEICGEYDLYKSNKYQNNRDMQPSMLYKDFEGRA
jgi:dCTP deaminase